MLKLDSHVDVLHRLYRSNIVDDIEFKLDYYDDLKVNVPFLLEGGVNSVFFALFIKHDCDDAEARERVAILFDILDHVLRMNPELRLCTSPSEILSCSKISVSLGLENGLPIGYRGLVEDYYDLGIRYITLCHNKSNQICDSSTDKPLYHGLSVFGKLIVKEMNKLGMMIDISHLSDESVLDVLNLTELPVIASHSCTYSVYNNPRNLNNYLLEKIAQNNGVIQLTVLPKCVGNNKDVKSFVDHVDHVRKLIGEDYIGFGSDFDGGGGIINCADISMVGNITNELVLRNYSPEAIDKFWGLNFLRVYETNSKGY